MEPLVFKENRFYENLQPCKNKVNSGLVSVCGYPIKNKIKMLEFKQKIQI